MEQANNIFDNFCSNYLTIINGQPLIDKNKEVYKDLKWKYQHSYNVAILCLEIAKSEKLSLNDQKLLYICGLFHDIGRFPQLVKCKSYDDHQGMDHGDLGFNILINENILGNAKITAREKTIIDYATLYHNKYRVPDIITGTALDPEIKYYTSIVRDADKIDIIKGIVDGNIPINVNDSRISPEVMSDLQNHQLVHFSHIKNANDQIALYFSYIFDIKSNKAKEIINDNVLLYKFKNKIGYNEELQKIYFLIKTIYERGNINVR